MERGAENNHEELLLGPDQVHGDPNRPSNAADLESAQTILRNDGIVERRNENVFEKECAQCAELIKLRAKACRFCGHKYSKEEILAQQKSIAAQTRSR